MYTVHQRCFRVMGKVVCDRQVNRNAGFFFENFAIFRSTKLKILFKDKNKNMTVTNLSPMLIKTNFSFFDRKIAKFSKKIPAFLLT